MPLPKSFCFDNRNVEILENTILYSGFYTLKQVKFQHSLFDGGHSDKVSREILIRPSAVAVLCYDARSDQVVLVEQLRVGALLQNTIPCSPWLLEVVAGLRESNEADEEVARREALEEAGIFLGRCEKIMSYFPSPGGNNEVLTLLVGEVDASQAHGIHGVFQEGEDILVHVITRHEAYHRVKLGTINNAAAIIALQWLQLNYVDLQQRWLAL